MPGLTVDRKLSEGNPVNEIISVARENNADVIVLGDFEKVQGMRESTLKRR